jgi:photosystem II stability/assembly factor-like uncharacterized protein
VSTPRIFPSTPGFVFKTTNGGFIWDTVLVSPSTRDLKMHPRDHEVLLAGLGSIDPPYGILKTTDGGNTWFHADSGLNVDGDHFVQVIEFDPEQPETLYAGTSGAFGGGLYKSLNGGETWSQIHSYGTTNIAINPQSTTTMYVGGTAGGVFKTTDGGEKWEQTSLPTSYRVNTLGIDPVDTDILYVDVGNPGSGFYRSTDGGVKWNLATTGMPPNTSGSSIQINGVSREVFVVVFPDSVGLFKSTDLGVTWERVDGLVSATWITDLRISRDYTHLYAGLDIFGVYRNTIVTGVRNDSHDLSPRMTIRQNYPNPFNAHTVIQYELLETDEVQLSVYDLLGNEVATLVKGVRTVGWHSAFFEGNNLSTGVYFARLITSSGESLTTRLVLVR